MNKKKYFIDFTNISTFLSKQKKYINIINNFKNCRIFNTRICKYFILIHLSIFSSAFAVPLSDEERNNIIQEVKPSVRPTPSPNSSREVKPKSQILITALFPPSGKVSVADKKSLPDLVQNISPSFDKVFSKQNADSYVGDDENGSDSQKELSANIKAKKSSKIDVTPKQNKVSVAQGKSLIISPDAQRKQSNTPTKREAPNFVKNSTTPRKYQKTDNSHQNLTDLAEGKKLIEASLGSINVLPEKQKFNLNEYIHTDTSPAYYTLALLDKSMVAYNLEAEDVSAEVRPFIHASAKSSRKSSLEVKAFSQEGSCPQHFIVQLKRRKAALRSALLTQVLLKEAGDQEETNSPMLDDPDVEEIISSYSVSEDEDEQGSSSLSEENMDEDEDDEEFEYAASMVLFPVNEESDKMLAYLIGSWASLLNTTSVIPSFGLKVVTSLGVASTLKDKDNDLSNIKEIVTETHRQAKPMRGTRKQQQGLGKISDFSNDPARDGLEKVRLKPLRNWGNSLLIGDDFLKFKLTKGKKHAEKDKEDIPQKLFTRRSTMYEVAKNVYKIYRKGSIHKNFTPYLDEPVDEPTSIELNKILQENWKKYFKKDEILYLHWTFWFRVRGEQDVSPILKKIRTMGYLEKINIDGQNYKAVQLVRSLPIPFCPEPGGINNFYWLDRGLWYRIHAARFEAIKKRIAEITVKQEDLFLPSYQVDLNSKDYKELAYNKAAIAAMRAQIENVSEAVLLDRENVSIGGRDDKFEFADILMQSSDSKYFLIHIKRERAGEFDHHRTQVERCALFLGENLDRRALPGLLITDILQEFYNKNIKLPFHEKKVKEKSSDNDITKKNDKVEQVWSSSFREKFNNEKKLVTATKGRGAKKKRDADFLKRINNSILNVKKPVRQLIKKITNIDEIKTIITRFEPYEDALCRCLDAVEDYFSYGIKKRMSEVEIKNEISLEKINPNFIKDITQLLEKALAFLEKHPSLTKKHQGILPHQERKNFTIVLGIIGDDSGKEDFHNQQLWGIDQTRKIVEKQGFNFCVVFIEDITKKPKNSDEDDHASFLTDHLSIDPGDLMLAKKNAEVRYSKDLGYLGVSDEILCSENGQKYVCIKLDGSKGDCCFHALGLQRKNLIKAMKSYVNECEMNLLDESVNLRVEQNVKLRYLCDLMFTTAKEKDVDAFKGHAFSDWNTRIRGSITNAVEQKKIDAEFEAMIEQQPAGSVDWEKVLASAAHIKDLIYKNTSKDDELILYKEFVEKCAADLWKRVGNNELTTALDFHLRNVGVLSDTGNQLRAITDVDLEFSALKGKKEELEKTKKSKPRTDEGKIKKKQALTKLTLETENLTLLEKNLSEQKIKSYIKYTFEFSKASAQRKNEILDEFYITNHEWLDPSAIMHLAHRFGIKAKLFKKTGRSSILYLNGQTFNCDSDDGGICRLMVYVNDNHYDLLFPIFSTIN